MEDKDKIKFAIRYLKLGLKSKRTPPLYEKLIQELGFEENDKIQELEKENAELNERLLKVENAYKRKSEAEWRLNDLYQRVLTDFANAEKCSREYFTRYRTMLGFYIKAKDILRRLMESQPPHSDMCEEADLVVWREANEEAEQFLKVTEEK